MNCRCFLFSYTKYDKNKTPTDKTAAIAMMLTEIVEPVSNKKKRNYDLQFIRTAASHLRMNRFDPTFGPSNAVSVGMKREGEAHQGGITSIKI